ncbi:hypothetical protein AA313_de0208735 [Arthrobotrys entomopaga]|nr:hypothetical protein AA313_de0208735 [Arthrobotrys entomopaga]
MGGLFSSLRTLRAAAVYDSVLTRLNTSPGLPLPNPTTAFWLLPESPTFKNIQSPTLPATADIVIIGSGITSTAILREIYRLNPYLRITLLEARGICTGATGRNGGHIKEGPYEEYPRLKKIYGADAAARILRFRLRHLEELKEVAREEGTGCISASEIREVLGTDVFFDEETMAHGIARFEEWKRELPDMGREWDVMDKETTRTKLHLPTAIGAITGPAGALWPYRLCTSILSRLITQHSPNLSIESYTPVENISYDATTEQYTVTTSRGNITTPTVIHATNAWVSHLVPGLRSKVFPFQGQMSAQEAPEGVPGMGDQYSWSFIHKAGFDYLTQRPTTSITNEDGTATLSAGEMMYGGGWASTGNNGMDVIGCPDDTSLNYLAASHLSGLLPFVFGSGVDENGVRSYDGVKVKYMWTGVLGFSADVLPWVGKIPASITKRGQAKTKGEERVGKGEWCAVGFSGEGMVNCWGCATALARMVMGEEVVKANVNVKGINGNVRETRVRALKGEEEVKTWREMKLEEWFPAEFVISEKRVARADPTDLVEFLIDV